MIPPPQHLWKPPLPVSFPLMTWASLAPSPGMIDLYLSGHPQRNSYSSQKASPFLWAFHDTSSIWKDLLYLTCFTYSSIKESSLFHIIKKLSLTSSPICCLKLNSLQHLDTLSFQSLSFSADQSFSLQMVSWTNEGDGQQLKNRDTLLHTHLLISNHYKTRKLFELTGKMLGV